MTLEDNGYERDEYDSHNPLYVIYQKADGTHGGSMRLLPSTGRTMVNEHFSEILGGGDVRSPFIWECTRFCLARNTEPRTAAALMLAGGEVMENFGVKHFVGVFDARMVRIYRMIGASPRCWAAQVTVARKLASDFGLSPMKRVCVSHKKQEFLPHFQSSGSSAPSDQTPQKYQNSLELNKPALALCMGCR